MRIRERPERRAEADVAHCLRQLARRFAPLAVDGCDVRADFGVLGDVAVVAIADLDLEVLRRDDDRAAGGSRGSSPSTSATTFSSLWKGIGIVGVLAAYSIMTWPSRRLRTCAFTQ